MTRHPQQSASGLSFGSTCLLALLAGGLMLGWLTGPAWAPAAATALAELGVAALLVVAAAGYGHLLVGPLAPRAAPGPFRALTASALGLWILSTGMLIAGSAGGGLLTPRLWWPIVAVGLILAGWQGRKAIMAWDLPRKAHSGALLWIVLALSAAVWLAGATRPPGYVGWAFADNYEVLEHHLQVPREFFEAGRIGQLKHNCYSYFPLGTEMLFLVGMCLRGGAYQGMYLAKLLHGTFGVLAAAGIWAAISGRDPARAKFSVGILAATPVALYLSWMAMVELAELCYLAFALLWLRQWLRDGSARSAALVGLMLGAGCAASYQSAALAAGPVLAMMLLFSPAGRGRVHGLVLAAIAATLPPAPWLVRNAVYTGNPVFPLATRALGRGHWSAESQRRWSDGHGPEARPPVPVPPGWQPQPQRTRPQRLLYDLLVSERFGHIPMVLVAAAICVLFASKGPPDRWQWSLVGVLVLQVLAWTFLSHQMPPRFIAPAAVPVALLSGGLLSRLSRVEANPFRRDSVRPPHGPWGQAPAGAIFLFAVGIDLFVACSALKTGPLGRPNHPIPPVPGDHIAGKWFPYARAARLPAGSRILLVGEGRPFYFPPTARYATAFDSHPLDRMLRRGLRGDRIVSELRAMGITHVWVDWYEIWRLARTCGYPASLSRELFDRWRQMRPPGLEALDRLAGRGLRSEDVFLPLPGATQPASAPAQRPPDSSRRRPHRFPRHWPVITIYRLPEAPRPGRAAGAAAASAAANRPL